MNETYIEFCLGHKLPGVKDSYFLSQPDSNGVHILLVVRPIAAAPLTARLVLQKWEFV
jgi:hypothetical protein